MASRYKTLKEGQDWVETDEGSHAISPGGMRTTAPEPADLKLAGSGVVFSSAGRGNVHMRFEEADWDVLVRNGFIARDEVALLKSVDEHPSDYTLHDEKKARQYVGVLLKLMANVTSDTKVQAFAVSRVEDVLSDLGQAKLFLGADGKLDPYPLMRAVESGVTDVQQVASVSLALLLTALPGESRPLVGWVCTQLGSGRGSSPTVRVAVQALAVLLRKEDVRYEFSGRGGVGHLNKLLRMQGGDSSNSQLLYELCFCLWCLSLEDDVRQEFLSTGAVATLVEQVSSAPREKVVRVALATLRNLTEGPVQTESFGLEMISCGLPKTLANMKNRPWADPDIAEDVQKLATLLQRNYRELSTFEKYAQEVQSGHLKWGVVHTERFWREEVRRTEQDDFHIIKLLIDLLRSESEEVVAIACYDLGEFVRFYPNGKQIAKHLGGKEVVMGLINSPNVDVQRQALQCVSKIMVSHWEYVR